MSIRILFVLAAALALLPGAARAHDNVLVATVGPGFTIDLGDAGGKHVSSVPAGHYTIVVHDLSAEHNFVFADEAGARVRIETEVEFVGDKSFEVDLTPGRYAYACAPHWQVMNGRLAAFPPSTTPPAAPAPKTLRATVATGGALSLSARRVAPGRYRLTVADRSPTRNFHLVGPGVNRRTARAFVGTATWTLTLARGTYRFGSDPRLSGRLVVE
jgi:hypothetical protein